MKKRDIVEQGGSLYVTENGVPICELWRRGDPEAEMAEARLIAQAPAVKEDRTRLWFALKDAVKLLRTHVSPEEMGGEKFDLSDCPPMQSILAALHGEPEQ